MGIEKINPLTLLLGVVANDSFLRRINDLAFYWVNLLEMFARVLVVMTGMPVFAKVPSIFCEIGIYREN